MLGKLFANEWKSTWKVPSAIMIYLAALTLLGCLSFLSPIWNNAFGEGLTGILAAFSMLIYIFSLIGAVIAIFIFFVMRFYRNMYTDQGYLMHTLPVKPYQHLICKSMVFTIWSIISILAVIVSVLLLMLTVTLTAFPYLSWADLAEGLRELKIAFIDGYSQTFSLPLPITVLLTILQFLMQLFASELMIFGAISIGQLFSKHRVMASFVSFICLSIGINFIYAMVQTPILIHQFNNLSLQATLTLNFWLALILNVLSAAGFFILTERIMSKKLNLE